MKNDIVKWNKWNHAKVLEQTKERLLEWVNVFLGGLSNFNTMDFETYPILVIFDTCHFLMIPGPFKYLSENGCSQ